VEHLLHVEEGRQQGEHDPPLVESHAVEDHEEDRVAVEARDHEVRDQVGREDGAPLAVVHPPRVGVADPEAEVATQVGEEGVDGVEQAILAPRLEAKVPVHELAVERREVVGLGGLLAQLAQAGPARREVLGHLLLADRRALEDAGDRREHLEGARGLHQVVVDRRPMASVMVRFSSDLVIMTTRAWDPRGAGSRAPRAP
jgi:hypothetical protein